MYEHRDKLLKQRRKEQLEKTLKKQRQKLYKNIKESLKKDFERIYPIVDEQNYCKHKSQLAQMVADQSYCYQISVFAPLVHDYLVQHHTDQDSVRILKFISQFQDIEIPQTYQLAFALSQLSHVKITDSLMICSNLLSLPRYQSLFRDRLIECRYLQGVEQTLSNNSYKDEQHRFIVQMISQIYCSMIASQPLLPLPKISEIIRRLKQLTYVQQTKWNILQTFSQIRQRMKTNKKYAKLVLSEFQNFMLSQRHGAQLQLFDFLIYAAYSNVFSQNIKIIQFITHSLTSHNFQNAAWLNQALECLILYIQQFQMDLQLNQVISLLLVFISQRSYIDRQQNILRIFNFISEQKIIQAIQQCECRDHLLEKTIKCIQNQQNLIDIAQFLDRIFGFEKIGLKQQFESYGGKKALETVYNKQNDELSKKIQNLLQYF